MSHSSPVQSTVFTRSSTSRQQIQTLPLSCSGPVAVLAATTPLKISINPLSQPTQVSVVVTILFLSQVPASVVQTNLAFGEHQPDFLAIDIKYHVSSHLIKLTLSEERQGSAVPLHLLFRLMPSQPYAPIHEVAEGRNQ